MNGFAGLDLNDGHLTPERVKTLADHMLSVGVTTFLPTLITAPEADIVRALTVIAEARHRFPLWPGWFRSFTWRAPPFHRWTGRAALIRPRM